MSRRALIVDADLALCEVLQDILRSAGIDAISVVKSAEAVARLQNDKFDVVFVDLGISALPGIELTRQTRGRGFNRMTPIILISGDRHRGIFSQGFNAGASFIVHKPIDKAHLIKLLRVAQGAMERERRRFRRIDFETRVRLTFANTQVEGKTVDVSLNGVFVQSSRAFPAGSLLQVELFLPSALKPIVGIGCVKRVIAGNRMGIQLEGFSLEDSGRLQDYLLPLLISQAPQEVPS